MSTSTETHQLEHSPLSDDETNEWTVYPSVCYSASPRCVRNSHESDLTFEDALLLPPGKRISMEGYVKKRLQPFINEGMQHTAAAVILAHERCSPRVLLLDVDTDENTFQEPMSSTLHSDPEISLLQTLSLPMFKYKRWEQAVSVLEQQLSQFIRYKSNGDSLSAYSTPSLSSGNENLSREEKNFSNVKQPFHIANSNSDATNRIPESFSNDVDTSRRSHPCFSIKSFLGVWCVPEFGLPPLPFIPSHVTRPKEQIHLYQVIVSPDCEFLYDPGSPFKLRFASLNFLLHSALVSPSKCLGVAYAGISSLLCRFSLAFMTAQLMEEADFKKDIDQKARLYLDSTENRTPYEEEKPL